MLTLAACLPALSQALFFDMTPEAERCFTEIVGEDTKMVVEYENPDFVPFGRPGFTGVVSWLLPLPPSQLFSRSWLPLHLEESPSFMCAHARIDTMGFGGWLGVCGVCHEGWVVPHGVRRVFWWQQPSL